MPRSVPLRLVGCLLAALALSGLAPAAAASHWEAFATRVFEPIAAARRLPYETATALTQDRQGAIWIGTLGGLARHDGYRVQPYVARPGESDRLPDNHVRALLALPDGGLLVGTHAGGLARFDPNTDAFIAIEPPDRAPGWSRILALAPARDGGAWVASEAGLAHWPAGAERIEPVPGWPQLSALSVLEEADGTLWVGSGAGLRRRLPDKAIFRPLEAETALAREMAEDAVWSLLQDAAGRLWFGTGRSGLGRVEDGVVHSRPGLSGRQGQAGGRTITALLEPSPGLLWAATDGIGIIAVDGEHAPTLIQHDPALPVSPSGDAVRAMLRDRSGNVWIATERGVNRHDTQARAVLSVLPSPLSPLTLSDQNVHSVAVDRQGRAWLGLGQGRIDVLDPATGALHRLQLEDPQTAREVQALLPLPDGSVLAGARGVARIDGRSLEVTPSAIPALEGEVVNALARDGDGLLVGTQEGMLRLDAAGRVLRRWQRGITPDSGLADTPVHGIDQIGAAGTWVGTAGGLSLFPPSASLSGSAEPITLRHDPGRPDSLPHDNIGSVLADARGRIWVGTFGGGVGVVGSWPPPPGEAPRFRTLTTRQGLSDNSVAALLPDAKGRIWASTARGLTMIPADGGPARVLTMRDGVRVRTYLPRSAARAPGGELLFGGLGGLSIVLPGRAEQPRPPPRIGFTGMALDGHAMPPGLAPTAGTRLDLPTGVRRLRVDFALLDFHAPAGTRYAYRLADLDQEWTEANPEDPAAHFERLPPGLHRLQVRAWTGPVGAGPAAETSLVLAVPPRWFESTWFGLLALMVCGLAVMGLVQGRTAYLRHRQRELTRLVDERTRELRAANRRLDRLAGTDPLTGLLNRRRFAERAAQILAEAEHGGPGFALVLFDLDRFKQLNDTHGHNAGDAALVGFCRLAARLCRPQDLLGRHGGEEIMLLVPGCDASGGRAIAERIRAAQAENPVSWEGGRLMVTVSGGVAAWQRGESLEALIHRADAALYAAKHGGRDQVRAA
ncbi:ligand-binding sensor domain-containing diguanylate cyclase [Teichococcus aestuarii]|uniref:diguanylate cyclase n=1 Tax=Teichococcus aestuarii TaxID=568898 RepID=A0A2U1V9Z0_9PROT|nr:ligand-binding sensor domain-containing diguanylate cyclase [Pseudoroseomonas aestuarii]PWC30751.1 GGDEF domain-containing protein [Pseudoroseomonas aestuarii]